jgi:hypothetical protein
MTHATFLLASGNVRATTGQSKLKRVPANQKWRAPRGENLRSENIEPENHLIRSVFAALRWLVSA